MLELPAGNLDEGEPPLAAAQRELREETGLHGGEWVEAATFYTSPGFTDEKMHLFLATSLEEGDAEPDAGEELEVVRVPLDELPSLLDEIEDAKTLVGLLLLLRYRVDGRFLTRINRVGLRRDEDRRRQGDQARRVPRRADAGRARSS